MSVVVDASVALKWVFPEEHTANALALWDVWQANVERLIAPPLFRAEVINVVHQRVRRGQIQPLEGVEIAGVLLPLVAIVEPDGLYLRALEIAHLSGLSATYDALYLAVAEAEGCELWTGDQRLVNAVRSHFPQVRWVGDAALDST